MRDPCGEPLVLRGVNTGIAFPTDPKADKIAEIAKTGANAVRLTLRWLINRSGPKEIEAALQAAAASHMIAVPALWDATGDWSQFQFAVDYWSHPAMVSVLRRYEDMIILNIANEAGGGSVTGEQYRDGYSRAIRQLRAAGLHMPLMIDAANWGRREADVLQNANYLLDQDPDRNLIFSWHPWDTGQPRIRYEKAVDAAAAAGIALVIGEFASTGADNKGVVDYRSIMDVAAERGIGWLWWWWSSGKSVDTHAMTTDGKYGNWVNVGEEVAISSPVGLRATAKRTPYLTTRTCDGGVPKTPTPPARPDGVHATAIEGAEVHLLWRDNSTDEKHFDIEAWDEAAAVWRLIKVVPADTNSTTVGGDLGFVYAMDAASDPSLGYSRSYRFRVCAYRARQSVACSEPTSVRTKADPRTCAGGDGLTGEYFSAEHKSQDFTQYESPNLVRVDPTIDFDWGEGSPDPKVASDHFQVRWSGFVVPQFSGSYQFLTLSDDFARVWVDGKPLIDNWRGMANGWAAGTISLSAGRRYPVRIEFREWDKRARVALYWAASRLQREIVPQCRLYSGALGAHAP